MFRCNDHHQGAHYLSLLKLQLLKQSHTAMVYVTQERYMVSFGWEI